jgi:hypothetical protein
MTTLSRCPPSSRGHSPLPAVLDDPSTLPKGDCRLRPSLDRKLICSHGQLAIVDAGQLLDDRLTVIVPHVDAMSEIRPAVMISSSPPPLAMRLVSNRGPDSGTAFAALRSEPSRPTGGNLVLICDTPRP